MDRLAKKCVITSGIVHGTLILLLIVGPAFLTSDSKSDTAPILTFTDVEAISAGAAVMGQGTPTGGRSTPAPTEPKPPEPKPPELPKPVPAVKIPEPRDEPKPVDPPPKPNTESTDPDKPRRPVVNLTQVVRNPNQTKPPKNNTADADKARAQAEAKANARQLANAIDKIRSGSSTGVDVGPVGVASGSGPSVAAYSDILRTIYFNSWLEPSDATMEDAIVKVSVTISNDGSVISARITKSSGDTAVDRSVQHLIDSVPFIKAFPADWKERQKEFKLSFSLKAKRSLG